MTKDWKWMLESGCQQMSNEQKVVRLGNLIAELLQSGLISQKEFFILRHRVGMHFKELYTKVNDNNDERSVPANDNGFSNQYREDECGQRKDQL